MSVETAKAKRGRPAKAATANTLAIITDGAALGKRIDQTVKMYLSAGARIHIEVVSALWHCAKNGNPFYLNRIYQALRPNDQGAVKLYIRRAHAIIGLEGENPDMQPAEIVQAAIEQGQVLKLTNNEFNVVSGHNTKQAQMLLKLCEERFASPDGETDKMVLDRNNFTEIKTLGDEDVLKRILAAARVVENGDTDTRKLKVSEPVRRFLKSIQDQAEALQNKVTLANG